MASDCLSLKKKKSIKDQHSKQFLPPNLNENKNLLNLNLQIVQVYHFSPGHQEAVPEQQDTEEVYLLIASLGRTEFLFSGRAQLSGPRITWLAFLD